MSSLLTGFLLIKFPMHFLLCLETAPKLFWSVLEAQIMYNTSFPLTYIEVFIHSGETEVQSWLHEEAFQAAASISPCSQGLVQI